MDRLYRSREDRMLAGVAGGLADLWDADPSVVRIVWALLAFFTGGIFLVVYIVMAIVVPEEPYTTPPSSIASDPSAPAAPAAPAAPLAPSAPLVDPRAARREARAARRASGSGTGLGTAPIGILIGGVLVALGAFFLVREYLPEIDFDWFWPLALIVLGAILILGTLGRGRGGPNASSGSNGPQGTDAG